MSEEFEFRQNAINGIITRIAMNNNNISDEQIARARSMYRYDTRSLDQIEKELEAYAEQITLHAEQSHVDKGLSEMSRHSSQQVERFVMVSEEPEVLDEQPNITEQNNHQQTYIPGLSLDQSDPTDELDAMFDSRRNVTSDFDKVDSLGMEKAQNKVLVKTPQKPQTVNNANNNNESGYGTVVSFLTIATMLSMVGVAVSFILIALN